MPPPVYPNLSELTRSKQKVAFAPNPSDPCPAPSNLLLYPTLPDDSYADLMWAEEVLVRFRDGLKTPLPTQTVLSLHNSEGRHTEEPAHGQLFRRKILKERVVATFGTPPVIVVERTPASFEHYERYKDFTVWAAEVPCGDGTYKMHYRLIPIEVFKELLDRPGLREQIIATTIGRGYCIAVNRAFKLLFQGEHLGGNTSKNQIKVWVQAAEDAARIVSDYTNKLPRSVLCRNDDPKQSPEDRGRENARLSEQLRETIKSVWNDEPDRVAEYDNMDEYIKYSYIQS